MRVPSGTGWKVRLPSVRSGRPCRPLATELDLDPRSRGRSQVPRRRRLYAPGADLDVELSYRDHALHLRVRDYGPGQLSRAPVPGHGLMGMRERAALAGGTFSAGPAEGGGFEVDVTLPTTETAS
jgi:hypothetical protein